MWNNLDDNFRNLVKSITGWFIQFLAIVTPIIWFLWQTSVARSVKLAGMESQISNLYQIKSDIQAIEIIGDRIQRIDGELETLTDFVIKAYFQKTNCEKLEAPKLK